MWIESLRRIPVKGLLLVVGVGLWSALVAIAVAPAAPDDYSYEVGELDARLDDVAARLEQLDTTVSRLDELLHAFGRDSTEWARRDVTDLERIDRRLDYLDVTVSSLSAGVSGLEGELLSLRMERTRPR